MPTTWLLPLLGLFLVIGCNSDIEIEDNKPTSTNSPGPSSQSPTADFKRSKKEVLTNQKEATDLSQDQVAEKPSDRLDNFKCLSESLLLNSKDAGLEQTIYLACDRDTHEVSFYWAQSRRYLRLESDTPIVFDKKEGILLAGQNVIGFQESENFRLTTGFLIDEYHNEMVLAKGALQIVKPNTPKPEVVWESVDSLLVSEVGIVWHLLPSEHFSPGHPNHRAELKNFIWIDRRKPLRMHDQSIVHLNLNSGALEKNEEIIGYSCSLTPFCRYERGYIFSCPIQIDERKNTISVCDGDHDLIKATSPELKGPILNSSLHLYAHWERDSWWLGIKPVMVLQSIQVLNDHEGPVVHDLDWHVDMHSGSILDSENMEQGRWCGHPKQHCSEAQRGFQVKGKFVLEGDILIYLSH